VSLLRQWLEDPAALGRLGRRNSLGAYLRNGLQRLLQRLHSPLGLAQLVQAEQADAEGAEICAFVTLQRYARGGQQVQGSLPCGTPRPETWRSGPTTA